MSIASRRVGLGLLVLMVVLVASLAAKVTIGSAATGSTPVVSQVNVAVHLKDGSTKSFANVLGVSLYHGAKKFKVYTRDGLTHTFGKSDFRYYIEGFVQVAPTTSPSPTPSPSSSGSPTPSPSSSTSVTATPTPTPTATTTHSATPTPTPSCTGIAPVCL